MQEQASGLGPRPAQTLLEGDGSPREWTTRTVASAAPEGIPACSGKGRPRGQWSTHRRERGRRLHMLPQLLSAPGLPAPGGPPSFSPIAATTEFAKDPSPWLPSGPITGNLGVCLPAGHIVGAFWGNTVQPWLAQLSLWRTGTSRRGGIQSGVRVVALLFANSKRLSNAAPL